MFGNGANKNVTSGQIELMAALIFAALGLLYLFLKSALNDDPEVDLKYIWVAGRLWADGINPYTDAFATIGDDFFDKTNTLDSWLYPPNWWAISRVLAIFDIETSILIWRILNAIFICLGVILVTEAFSDNLGKRRMIAAAVFLGYAATMQATPQVLSICQTSIILYLGICVLIFGMLKEKGKWIVVGLILVALKPQAGIVVFSALIAVPALWYQIMIAAALTVILCMPAFLSVGFTETVTTVISAYLSYDGALEVNSAANTTGLRHLIKTAFGAEVSSLGMSLLASLVAFLLSLFLQRRSGGKIPCPDLVIMIPLVLISFVAFHSYDFILVAPLIVLIFIPRLARIFRICIGLGLLLIYRSGNLAKVTGFMHPDTLYLPGTQIDSLASLFLFTVFFLFVLSRSGPLLR